MNKTITILICLILPIYSLTAQNSQTLKIEAVRITQAPKIDGVAEEELWKNLPMATDFTTNTPEFGKTPSQKTQVKLAYDNTAFYVLAYMYDTNIANIKNSFTNRDDFNSVDNFAVCFDTYKDNLNGFRFHTTIAGVQADARMSSGGQNQDFAWDAVWECKTKIIHNGWIAEMKIPFSALRFVASSTPQNWGLQFARFISKNGELSTWSPVNPSISGIINQWGILSDIKNIKPPIRLSLYPYLTFGVKKEPISNDIYSNLTTKTLYSGGMDIKYGISESFTLDMTLVPDFTQVQSDKKIYNLSPFEVKYNENRPFFTEGTELFRNNMFYTRRIGGTPSEYFNVLSQIDDTHELIKNPSNAQLVNATKISGYTKNNLGMAFLNAVVAPTYAQIKNITTNKIEKILTEPLSNYNVLSFKQALKHNSTISFLNTNVLRKGGYRDANVSEVGFNLLNAKNTYALSGYTDLSIINSPFQFNKIQIGTAYMLAINKISGNLQYGVWHEAINEKFDQNDLGYLNRNNKMVTGANIQYYQFEKKQKINNWKADFNINYNNLYKPVNNFESIEINASIDFTAINLWQFGFFANSKPIKYFDYFEPRVPGQKLQRPPYAVAGANFNTNYQKNIAFYVNLVVGESPVPNDTYYSTTISGTFRINNHFKLENELKYERDNGTFGFEAINSDNTVLIAIRNITTQSNAIRLVYAVNPNMSFNTEARYYWLNYKTEQLYNLQLNGSLIENNLEAPTANFNAWNIDFSYQWQFAPGSNLIFTWKNNIDNFNFETQANVINSLKYTFSYPKTNLLAVKLVYYLDYVKINNMFKPKAI